MRIAAIYIDKHEYLFDKSQTINFGGEYFYTFSKKDEDVVVNRGENEKFVEGLFQLTDTESKVTQLNAIVGENGAGKTSIIDVIRRAFVGSDNALPGSKSLMLVESEESKEPIILRNDFGKIYLYENEFKIELKPESNISVQSIYYSPHYDYKLNRNFDNVDDHDISFFKIVERDLENLNSKKDIDTGLPYSPSYELLFKNSLRHIEFLSSELVSTNEVFKDIFTFPNLGEPLLEIIGFDEKESDWNTPYPFRSVISKIKKKVENELDDWVNVREIKEGNVYNQLEVYQYLLKRNIVDQVLILIHRKMEGSNSFLHDGDVLGDDFEDQLEDLDAYESFLLFLEKISIKERPVFQEGLVRDLFSKIYQAIDKINEGKDTTQNHFITDSEIATEILKLQRIFLNELNSYFYLLFEGNEKPVMDDYEKVEPFINYMPTSKRLSSGEYALLNLFSRLYNFLTENLKDNRFRELKDHYILMLDEGDLSFHPTWKKKYVKSILSTIPHFFNELENRPSIHIVFSTHDPLTLSDVPNSNVIYIEKDDKEESNVLDFTDERRPQKTFGANIAELLSDSFFIDDSLTGEFATDLIAETIDWLNRKEKSNAEYYKNLIGLIDEPIVKRKLAEMFDNKMGTETEIDILRKEIIKLEEEIQNKSKN